MCLSHVFSKCSSLGRFASGTVILVIHNGSNDLRWCHVANLIYTIRNDIEHCGTLCNKVIIV